MILIYKPLVVGLQLSEMASSARAQFTYFYCGRKVVCPHEMSTTTRLNILYAYFVGIRGYVLLTLFSFSMFSQVEGVRNCFYVA